MKKIALSGKRGQGLFALVDDEDYPLLSRLSWCLTSHNYVKNRLFYMHSLILGFPRGAGVVVDHKDRNKLNNQKENLRLTTQTGNTANREKTHFKYTSNYKGVYWRRNGQRWCTQVTLKKAKNKKGRGGKVFIGSFDSEHYAALMYDFWATDSYGEYACTNFKVVAHSGQLA